MKKHLLYTLLLLTTFCLFACSASNPSSDSHVSNTAQGLNGPLGCSTDAQCQSVTQAQAGNCADLYSGVCMPDHTCAYWLDTSNINCHCIVGEQRKCAAGGYQTCFQQTNGSDWPAGNTGCTYQSQLNFSDHGQYKSCTPWRWQDCLGSTAGYIPACSSIDTINSGNGCWPDINGNGQCIIDVTTDPAEQGCPCVEDQVRPCIKAGSTQGQQVCLLDSGHTASNSWGHPTVWSSCY